MMHATRVKNQDLTEERLDANYYAPVYLANAASLAACGFELHKIGSIAARCNCGATPKQVEYESIGIGLIRTADVRPNLFGTESVLRTKAIELKPDSSVEARPGDMVYTMSGTIGFSAVIPFDGEKYSFSNTIARARLPRGSPHDIHYVSTFFNSERGFQQSLRLVSGGIQGHVMPNPFKKLSVPCPKPKAQTYIGSKVRLADRFRKHARNIKDGVFSIANLPELASAVCSPNPKTNWIHSNDLKNRLDSKYYGLRAMSVEKAARSLGGVTLGSLGPCVSNGFESREFVEIGRPYVTVSEVSSGRLSLESAPRIPYDVEVPDKAKLTPTCTLVVRTGSIGIAVKPHAQDSDAVISSHLIRLQFPSEETAAAVTVFLGSSAGGVLQHKISYGAVQPQIGQEELLRLPIPQIILSEGPALAKMLNDYEASIRGSQCLNIAAKLLIEALIDGKIGEAELVAAQEALESGDHSADRALLRRLTRRGLDVPGEPPLFPDLDTLYDLLAQTEEAPT